MTLWRKITLGKLLCKSIFFCCEWQRSTCKSCSLIEVGHKVGHVLIAKWAGDECSVGDPGNCASWESVLTSTCSVNSSL